MSDRCEWCGREKQASDWRGEYLIRKSVWDGNRLVSPAKSLRLCLPCAKKNGLAVVDESAATGS